MTLLAVRQQFAELTGRHDLVTDFSGADYSNNGADFFLDSGQRMLDRKASYIKGYMWYKKDVAAGEYSVKFQQAAAVKQVWAMESGEDRYMLEKKDYDWMRTNYGEAYTSLTQDSPSYYSPLVMGLSPEQKAITSSNYTDTFTHDAEEILFTDVADHYDYHGILFMPPADTTYTISVLARFRSAALDGDTDKTFWTEVHPDILLLAGMWSMERYFRNTEGQADYLMSIVDAINDLDKDVVEEEVQDLDSMWG